MRHQRKGRRHHRLRLPRTSDANLSRPARRVHLDRLARSRLCSVHQDARCESREGRLRAQAGPGGSGEPLGFAAAVKQADAARQKNRLADAIPLYEKALKLDPRWTEGWWLLGTSNYELDRYQPARDAFRRSCWICSPRTARHGPSKDSASFS